MSNTNNLPADLDNDNATRRELNAAIKRADSVYVMAIFISGVCGEYVRVAKSVLLAALGPAALDRAGKDGCDGYDFTIERGADLYLN